MRILGHGVDLVEWARIQRVWELHERAFLERVYSPSEQKYCLDRRDCVLSLAGRFAAKEAVLKALGTGWRGGIRFTDVETLPDALGKPEVRLSGEAARIAQQQGITSILLSISHAGAYATASAIAVGPDPEPA